ncbi:MAG: hypothetical protein K0V04_13775 [Deltaproteobacteria bacterium]|nr:hypothetical protein [Deltaproteobacteria bacterium]
MHRRYEQRAKRPSVWSSWLFAVALGGLPLGLSCADDDRSCSPGHERCECVAGTCLAGLSCLSNYCVDPDWEPGDEAATANPADGAQPDDGPGDSPDNVAACQALADELVCGSTDVSNAINCSLYADLPCDITDYFDCARETFACIDSVPDTSGWLECAELAICD